ncbi:MAG TPA: hypothetical protein VM869_09860 [Enhygromyxa sp.]|nr:hypothetical protein [Enhygromyxa sp.]
MSITSLLACEPADEPGTDDLDLGTPRAGSADAGDDVDQQAAHALADLRSLHAKAITRRLAALDADARAEADRYFVTRGLDPTSLPLRYTSAGTPRSILTPGFRLDARDLELGREGGDPLALADAFIQRFAPLWKVDAQAFAEADLQRHPSGDVISIVYRQRHRGLEVIPATLAVHVDTNEAAIIGVTGGFVPIGELSVEPKLGAEEAAERVEPRSGERIGEPSLVIWSGHRSSGDATPHLAWKLPLGDEQGPLRRVLVDAIDGEVLLDEDTALESKQRVHWDHHGLYGDRMCHSWETSWPPSGCHASCAPCVADPRACASCACPDPTEPDPPECFDDIWRYVETSGCVGDGLPLGEGACDSQAQLAWDRSGDAYDYWWTSFGRDSWDGAGGTVFSKTGVYFGGGVAGQARMFDEDGDNTPELAWASINDGSASDGLLGHELGHVLQYGSWIDDGSFDSMYGTAGAAMESNADWHSYRYLDDPIYSACTSSDLTHYTHLWTSPGTFFAQVNKYIGNCQGWLMSQALFGNWWHRGVTTTPIAPADFDKVWYRALDVYHHTSDDYFTWWDSLGAAAFDVFGWSAALDAAVDSTDAVGRWTAPDELMADLRPDERYASLSWAGASHGPCLFYRPTWDSTRIMYQCRWNGTTWFQTTPLNDPAVDPAASEPATAYRYESGKIYGYVLWRGTDDRIHYRRFDLDTLTKGPPGDLGPGHLTSGPVAAASVWETAFVDRLVIVYHPKDHPTWFYWTYLGSPSAGVDMGPSFDTDAPPAMAAYPYPGRAYFVRPNFAGGTTSRRLRYASYTFTGGWTAATDLTALYDADTHMLPGVVRTDRGVSLAAYGASDERLRMSFVTLPLTSGDRELWLATLRESTVGVLGREDYRAVPLESLTPYTSQSAGALAPDPMGAPLWHFWGRGTVVNQPRLHESRMHSD